MIKSRSGFDCLIYSFSSFITGFLFSGLLLFHEKFETTFCDVKITDVVEIIVMLGLGSTILYRITIRTTNEIRKNEILIEAISLLQKKVEELSSYGRNYMTDPKNTPTKDILIYFRSFANHISLTEKVCADNDISHLKNLIKEIKAEFFVLKGTVTGGAFGVPEPKYSQDDFSQLEKSYQSLMLNVFKLKFKVFN